jgi:hypothetical protein
MVVYDADYYERGIETGKSNYQNYRWIPELTIPMAMTIIDFLGIRPDEVVLDYGCSKGYLVKALRMLHRDAWGFDISEYALKNADNDTTPYLLSSMCDVRQKDIKYGIFKDVLEHIELRQLLLMLSTIRIKTIFAVIPLGEAGEYVAPANNKDVTHVICKNKDWWLYLLDSCGWECVYSSFQIKGIKDSYYANYPESHLFVVANRK